MQTTTASVERVGDQEYEQKYEVGGLPIRGFDWWLIIKPGTNAAYAIYAGHGEHSDDEELPFEPTHDWGAEDMDPLDVARFMHETVIDLLTDYSSDPEERRHAMLEDVPAVEYERAYGVDLD